MEKCEQDAMLRLERMHELVKFVLLLLFSLCIIVCGILMVILEKEYPTMQELSYEECTFIRYEYKEQSKTRYYLIYVAEYKEPLKISGPKCVKVNRNRLSAVAQGDHICVSIGGSVEKHPYLYCISYNGLDILSYEDYLKDEMNNDQARVWLGWAVICIGIFECILVTRHYLTTGKAPPVRSRFGRQKDF